MSDKKRALEKIRNMEPVERRKFLEEMTNMGKLLMFGSVVFPSGALLASGCAKPLNESTVPGVTNGQESLSVQVLGARDTDDDGNPAVRANGEDTMEFVATARGLSSSIGFYLPVNWGLFSGGTLDVDGYTYFTADEDGKARVLFTAGATAGRAELHVKSNQKTIAQKLTFDFATMTLYPSLLVFDGMNDTMATVVARGGVAPYEWFVSHPRALSLRPSGDRCDILIKDWTALVNAGTTGATITCLDSEGVAATGTIKSGNSTCTAGALTTNPSSIASATTTMVSFIYEDFDKYAHSSISVQVVGIGFEQTVTLTPWIAPGVFQGSASLTPPAGVGPLTATVVDSKGTDCRPLLVEVIIAVTA